MRERDWERSVLLTPRPAPAADPELISDGGGMAFSPGALDAPDGGLDPEDPAVGALLTQLGREKAPKAKPRAPWKRGAAPVTTPDARPPLTTLGTWRQLARSADEALFGRGRPPQLLTVAVRREGRGGAWTCVGTSAGRPLRASRDGIRASGWRLDPDHELTVADTVLRVLVTEQTYSGGSRADGRLLAPDLYLDDDELVLWMFITPRGGFQTRVPNPETPARVALPEPVGERLLIDGAIYPKQSSGED